MTGKFHFRFLLLFLIVVGAFASGSSVRRTSAESPMDGSGDHTWQDTLYEPNVSYEEFACDKTDAKLVAAFFNSHPRKSYLPICHNDCPIVKCRPVVPFPNPARDAGVHGSVAVHILVDEKGKVLYARVLDGHPLLRTAVKHGACETQFREYPYGKHQGVMHFTVEGNEYLGVPYTANEVRQH